MSPEPDPTLRASDADRDAVAERLREAHAEGRLTVEEVGERLDAAFAARTLGELPASPRDLPGRAGPGRPDRRRGRGGREVRRPRRGGASRRGPARRLGHLGDRGAGDVGDLVRQRLSGTDWGFFWPVWVAGPWGAVLLARTLFGRRAADRGDRAGEPGGLALRPSVT